MVTLPVLVRASSELPALGRILEQLPNQERDRLTRLADDFFNLLAPLARVKTVEHLEVLLEHLSSGYVDRMEEIVGAMSLLDRPTAELQELIEEFYTHVRSATNLKADLFGKEALGKYLGAVDSAEALAGWALRTEHKTLDRQDAGLLRRYGAISQKVTPPALRAGMSIIAAFLIVSDQIDRWESEALAILCEKADDLMTEVEDTFLSETEAVELDDETVEYDSVRRELGL